MKKLYRSKDNKIFAGVCGGIAEYVGRDANLIRLLYVVVTLVTHVFPLFIVYLLAAVLLPEKGAGDVEDDGVIDGKVL